MKKETIKKTIIFDNGQTKIKKGTLLPKLGAGIDGYVYQYNDLALKVLKGTPEERKQKNLMIFEKTLYFLRHLSLTRITTPINILLDEEGIYCGYVMKYLHDVTKDKESPFYMTPSLFTCEKLDLCIEELRADFEFLNQKHVKAKDINYGSYIFTENFMHLCDMDKYQIKDTSVTLENRSTLNYIIARFISTELKKTLSEEELRENKRTIDKWIKLCCNNPNYLTTIQSAINNQTQAPIIDYIEEEKPKILKLKHK